MRAGLADPVVGVSLTKFTHIPHTKPAGPRGYNSRPSTILALSRPAPPVPAVSPLVIRVVGWGVMISVFIIIYGGMCMV